MRRSCFSVFPGALTGLALLAAGCGGARTPSVAGWARPGRRRCLSRTSRLGWGRVLGPVAESRTIRIRADELIVGDGRVFGQSAQVAGFNILDCADLDEALDVASKDPGASVGVLESRPIGPLGLGRPSLGVVSVSRQLGAVPSRSCRGRPDAGGGVFVTLVSPAVPYNRRQHLSSARLPPVERQSR